MTIFISTKKNVTKINTWISGFFPILSQCGYISSDDIPMIPMMLSDKPW